MNSELIIYQNPDGNIKIDVHLESETVWLTQAQLCELFQKSKATISEHIKNVFEEGELDAGSTVRKFRTVQNKAIMASESEIESFLKQMKEKIPVFEITFRQRQKNFQALADLNISAKQRIEQILDLNMKDYCSRPNKDSHVPGDPDYYVFGKTINGIEVYVKIRIGRPQRMVDCISFHLSDHSLTYPFRT